MRFVDTNVLVYAVSRAPEDAEKRTIAREVLASRDLVASVQVLQEFYNQATRPTGPCAMLSDEAVEFIEDLRRYPIQTLTLDVFWTGLALHRRFGISHWDGAILAAAQHSGCTSVLTEDLNDGQDYDGIRVVNPFASAGGSR